MKKEQGDLVKESPFLQLQPLQKVSYHSACPVYCLMYMLHSTDISLTVSVDYFSC